MNAYSWNVLFENARIEDAFAFIRDAEFDIFCLQEVPDELFAMLETLPTHLASTIEYRYVTRDGLPRHTYSMILSRHPIVAQEGIAVPNWFLQPIFRERVTTWLLRFFRIWNWTKSSGQRSHLSARVDLPGFGITQVYSAHLTIHSPAARRRELSAIEEDHGAGKPTLLCGDLNIFDTYRVSILGWFFGATILDALMPWRERAWAESWFASLALKNPLRGMITHGTTRAQLDHILPSGHFVVDRAEVVKERYGSDHNPVRVTLSARTHEAVP